MNIPRRNFLQGGLAWGLLGSGFLNVLARQASAAPGVADKKMIFIFQRGGNDGINTVVPRGDLEYNTTLRPSLYLPPNPATDLGNGFAELHPAMEPMMEIFNNLGGAGGPGAPGNLAVIHRAGYASQSRSHFDSQDYWERGAVGSRSRTGVTDGMIYRHLIETGSGSDAFAAASISSDSLLSLTGDVPFPNFTSASQFDFLGNAAQRTKFLGESPDPLADPPTLGKGILGLYGGSPLLGKPASGIVHATGTALGSTISELKEASAGGYIPENGAVYPDGRFGTQLEQAAMVLKRTSAKIVGINIVKILEDNSIYYKKWLVVSIE
jgi:hypothetical protein